MIVEWLVAKYVSDLARGEPRNIGVVVRYGPKMMSRFLGERDDGTVDGRAARTVNAPAAYYKVWVESWKRRFAEWEQSEAENVQPFLRRRPTDNYYLDYGGERLVGTESTDAGTLLGDLFLRLVASVQPVEETVFPPASVLADRVFKRLGIAPDVKRGMQYKLQSDDELDVVRFHYGYQNGSLSLMQRLALGPAAEDSDSWAAVHDAAWSFFQISRHPQAPDQRLIALVKFDATDEEVLGQIELLKSHRAVVVNITDDSSGAADLEKVLHGAPETRALAL
jgi:hypothetical protein